MGRPSAWATTGLGQPSYAIDEGMHIVKTIPFVEDSFGFVASGSIGKEESGFCFGNQFNLEIAIAIFPLKLDSATSRWVNVRLRG